MSAIITSILSSTLKVFIKDYNKQQLNFKLFGGEITFDSFRKYKQLTNIITKSKSLHFSEQRSTSKSFTRFFIFPQLSKSKRSNARA